MQIFSTKNPKWDRKPLWLSQLEPREHPLRSREVMAREVAATFHIEAEEFSHCGLLWITRQSCWGGTESRSEDAFAPVLPGRTLLRRPFPFAPARHTRFTPWMHVDSDEIDSSIGPDAQILSDCGDSLADHRRGLVVEVAPNVVDATAVVLPPPDVVESLRVPAFDPMDSDDEFDDAFPRDVSGGVPVEAVVEPSGFGARHSGRFAVLATDVDDDLDSPSLVDAFEFDLTRTDHEEVLVQSTVMDDDNVFLGTIEDKRCQGIWLHQSHTLVAVKHQHTVDLNDVSCLLTAHQFWTRVLTTVPVSLTRILSPTLWEPGSFPPTLTAAVMERG